VRPEVSDPPRPPFSRATTLRPGTAARRAPPGSLAKGASQASQKLAQVASARRPARRSRSWPRPRTPCPQGSSSIRTRIRFTVSSPERCHAFAASVPKWTHPHRRRRCLAAAIALDRCSDLAFEIGVVLQHGPLSTSIGGESAPIASGLQMPWRERRNHAGLDCDRERASFISPRSGSRGRRPVATATTGRIGSIKTSLGAGLALHRIERERDRAQKF